ncbi:MAG: EI24 domain-containing protein [Myxococcales bacterium]|nr:EI24 domain-containing protein [Myxococcales bacterium]
MSSEVLHKAIRGAAAAPKALSFGFWSGFRYPLRGLRFVFLQHPELARIWIFPILLTALGLFGMTYLAWGYHDALSEWIWSAPTEEGFWASVGRFFHAIFEFVLGALLVIVGIVIVSALTTVIAAPFNDALSEEVERLSTGRAGPPFAFSRLLRDLLRTVGLELLKLLLYASVMLPALLLSFALPAIGQVLYSIFAFLFTALYFAIDYVDWPAARRNLGVGYRTSIVRRRFLPMFGFGTGVWLFLLIPLLNLLFMPAAVAGGTLLFIDMEGPAPPEQGGDPRAH